MRGALNPQALEAFPNVAAWLDYVKVEMRESDPSPDFLLALAERNVVKQLANLRTHPAVAARLEAGDITLRGWVYDIGAGTVSAWDEAALSFVPLR
jgi:carbonic anhydrase